MRIRKFVEKPADPPGTPDDPEQTFVSMGNYIFTTKVLIDCDPGIDDALAIALAHGSAELDVVGLTTVGGNVGLEHTTNNLDVTSENLSASESRIRDVDMAAEMVKITRAQDLRQSAMATLAQANQAPQAVLSLLR